MKLKKIIATSVAVLSMATPIFASTPANFFGSGEGSGAIHFSDSLGNNREQVIHFSDFTASSTTSNNQQVTSQTFQRNFYSQGERIGTLRVERLNRTISIFEGETMSNMDRGAARFSHSGWGYGNTALIAHNRGHASNGNWFGFFDFVRLLYPGDIVILETNHGIFRYKISHEIIVHHTNTDELMHQGDNRISLVTCLEYRQQYRRIAIGLRI